MPRIPEKGARMVFRSIVALISPTWASVDFGQLPVRLGRGQLGPLLLGIEFDQYVTYLDRFAGLEMDLIYRSRQISAHRYTLDRSRSSNDLQGGRPCLTPG